MGIGRTRMRAEAGRGFHDELSEDAAVIRLREDIAQPCGAFEVTDGFLDPFGPTRFASRAGAYGTPGLVVDGQNALERTRRRHPPLVAMKADRYSSHLRSDAATYRPECELGAWRRRDPIELLDAMLVEEGVIGCNEGTCIEKETAAAVEQVIEEAKQSPKPPLSARFDHVSAGARP